MKCQHAAKGPNTTTSRKRTAAVQNTYPKLPAHQKQPAAKEETSRCKITTHRNVMKERHVAMWESACHQEESPLSRTASTSWRASGHEKACNDQAWHAVREEEWRNQRLSMSKDRRHCLWKVGEIMLFDVLFHLATSLVLAPFQPSILLFLPCLSHAERFLSHLSLLSLAVLSLISPPITWPLAASFSFQKEC